MPHHKTLDEFDASFQPELDPKQLAELRSLRFVQIKVFWLILGPPGAGKNEVGSLRLEHADANRCFQLIHRRYTRSKMLTINGPSWRLRGRGELLNIIPTASGRQTTT